MKTFARLLGVLLLTLTSVGCDGGDEESARTAGPNASEQGLVTYWKVAEALPLEYSQCTDATDWRDTISAPEFSPNSYLMYKVLAGGVTAQGQSCSTTSASSCSDSERTWTVDGNVLTSTDAPAESPQAGYDCSLEFTNVWTVTDNGETGRLTVEINVSLVGDEASCDTLDGDIAAAGTNSLGFDGCKIAIPVDVTFFKAE